MLCMDLHMMPARTWLYLHTQQDMHHRLSDKPTLSGGCSRSRLALRANTCVEKPVQMSRNTGGYLQQDTDAYCINAHRMLRMPAPDRLYGAE